MKVTKSEIKAMIQEVLKAKLQEAGIVDDLIPGSDGKLSAYMTKVTKFLDSTIEDAEKLALEGEEIMKVNVTQDNSVGERNRLLLLAIGFLRKVRFTLASNALDLRKAFG